MQIYSQSVTLWQVEYDYSWFQIFDDGGDVMTVQRKTDLDGDGDHDWENVGTIHVEGRDSATNDRLMRYIAHFMHDLHDKDID